MEAAELGDLQVLLLALVLLVLPEVVGGVAPVADMAGHLVLGLGFAARLLLVVLDGGGLPGVTPPLEAVLLLLPLGVGESVVEAVDLRDL